MRTVVDLPEEQLKAIKALAKRDRISQAEAIRRAIRSYVDAQHAPDEQSPAFGLWSGRDEGLQYQRAFRNEWDE